MLDAQDHRK